MGLVLDASVAAAWVLPDEASGPADAVLEALAEDVARVPSLFWHEVRNILVMAARRGRLPVEEVAATLARLRRLPIEEAGTGADAAVLSLAERHRLSAYDAAYLALAVAEGAAPATLDRSLAEAALREGLAVRGYASA